MVFTLIFVLVPLTEALVSPMYDKIPDVGKMHQLQNLILKPLQTKQNAEKFNEVADDINKKLLAHSKEPDERLLMPHLPKETAKEFVLPPDLENLMNAPQRVENGRKKSSSASAICCERLGYPDCKFMVQFPERWSGIFRQCIKIETTLNYIQSIKHQNNKEV